MSKLAIHPGDGRPLPRGHRWQPGQSGNPKGRAPGSGKSAETIIRSTVESIGGGYAELAELMIECARGKAKDDSPSVMFALATVNDRRAAIEWLWNRGYGKPRETIDMTTEHIGEVTVPARELTDAELATLRVIHERLALEAPPEDAEIVEP
jgi:hypothetical protein